MSLNTLLPGSKMEKSFWELLTLTKSINLSWNDEVTGPIAPWQSVIYHKKMLETTLLLLEINMEKKSNHVRLSMKDQNEPSKGGIEPAFFRKPSSRQEGNKLHIECEIEALPKPDIRWYRNDQEIQENEKYSFYRAVQQSNVNIHFARLTVLNPGPNDGGNYVVRAVNEIGDKDCTIALNFGDLVGDENNVPAKIYEQPQLKQPDPNILILEAHIHANPKPKITWLCNGDFIKESDRKYAKLEPRVGEKNKWNATLTIVKPTKADSGDIKCSAKNKWGNDHTTFNLS
ncbi:SPEG neighbor protein-like isoform X1 [Lepeophtheirus salmonis]|uniref:SPEG neighbor protein-like isoform X1 n=1 Tax=Lepeophtheirus salmonis TaxID=72036 RepID=UPI003AF3697B